MIWLIAFADFAKNLQQEQPGVIVVNRLIEKKSKFQVIPLFTGVGERGDFFRHFSFSGSLRYFLNEKWGVEIISIESGFWQKHSVLDQIRNNFGIEPNVEFSVLNIHSSLIMIPLYSKVSFFNHFFWRAEGYGLIGGGVRFYQPRIYPSMHLGLGFQNFFTQNLGLNFEYQLRGYLENRLGTVFVLESHFKCGLSWLF